MKKLRESKGMSMVEVLAATVVLVLLALVMDVGLKMNKESYIRITEQNEAELLLSTAVDAVYNELRSARDVYGDFSVSPVVIKYKSFNYGELDGSGNYINNILKSDSSTAGQLQVCYEGNPSGITPKSLLPTAAYGAGGKYKVELSLDSPDFTNNYITFNVAVKDEDGNTIVSTVNPDDPSFTGVKVHWLNVDDT